MRIADKEVNPENIGIEARELSEDGTIFDQNGVRVTMFAVDHDPAEAIVPAVGYRVDYNGNSVLISGTPDPLSSGHDPARDRRESSHSRGC